MRAQQYVHPVTLYRQRHQVTLKELGARLDPPMSKSTLSRIEAGLRKPSFDQIAGLVRACGYEFTADQLIHYTPSKRVA
jgi:transcriptional regulator with XRE-family HTH domain